MSLGALSLVVDLNNVDNGDFQQGRDAGHAWSIAQGIVEVGAGGGAAAAGINALLPTLGGGAACALATGGTCAAPAATALEVEGAMAIGGTLAATHGGAMVVYASTHPRSKIKAIEPPTNRGGLRDAMEKAGGPPSGMQNAQAHHNLPWKFREWFAGEGRGLNVNDPAYGRWVSGAPEGPHQSWNAKYNDAWRAFIQRNRNATQRQVLNFMNKLMTSGEFPAE